MADMLIHSLDASSRSVSAKHIWGWDFPTRKQGSIYLHLCFMGCLDTAVFVVNGNCQILKVSATKGQACLVYRQY